MPWAPTAVRGDDESGLGWWSRRLESREPSWLLGGIGTAHGPVTVVATLLRPGDGPELEPAAIALVGDHAVVTWSDGATERRETVRPAAARRTRRDRARAPDRERVR